ncbi:hypothetical protein [Actinomyces sp.]|uniref:hypothetical protein n=1 Tax=Actinomyces sp. TaxID=29317 RepID=UPI002898510B|nr:hypothetical protein [Actinomyces sp.]
MSASLTDTSSKENSTCETSTHSARLPRTARPGRHASGVALVDVAHETEDRAGGPRRPGTHRHRCRHHRRPATPGDASGGLFGPNVTVFDGSWSTDDINSTLQAASHETEFSQARHQFFFAPGTYGSPDGADDPLTATDVVNSELGYYQVVSGLGASPEDVTLNGSIHVEPVRTCEATPWDCQAPGSLTRFWRSLSNMTINPIQQPVGEDAERPFPSGITEAHQMRYAVSQAAPLRRMNITGGLTVFGRVGEYASGGYMANSRVSGAMVSGSQQQWYTRNSELGSWEGGVWNMVFSGVSGAPATNFGSELTGAGADRSLTNVESTPVSREAPFLYVSAPDAGAADLGDAASYSVFVPRARTDSTGVDWSTGADAGTALPLSSFRIAHEGDSAADLNASLAAGKNLLLTPGVYHLSEALRIERADTVVLGLGMATLTPDAGTAAIEVGDVAGVKIAGLTVDAGAVESPVLVRVGPEGASTADPADPTTLTDVFIRVGGPWVGRAVTSIEVNSPHTLLDHIWAWRADHASGGIVDDTIGWSVNTADHGLVVNGDDVVATGLFVEHYQKNQVVWNGEGGRTVFYQSELPYDPPTQSAWMDGDSNGYASYRVADGVRTHAATGLGVYSFFDPTRVSEPSVAASAVQVPDAPGVSVTSAVSVFLDGIGGITNIVNDEGGAVSSAGPTSRFLVSYTTPDTTAPVVTASVDEATRTVTLSATDDFSGVASIEYALGEAGEAGAAGAADEVGGAATLADGEDGDDWTVYSGPVALPDDVTVLRYRATDVAGNVSEVGSVEVALSPTPTPTPTPSGSGGSGGSGDPSQSPTPAGSSTGNGKAGDLARTGSIAEALGLAALAVLALGTTVLGLRRRSMR